MMVQKCSIICAQTEMPGFRGGPGEGGHPTVLSPLKSRPVAVSNLLKNLGVLPPKPVFFSTNNSDLRGFLLVESRELLIIVLPFLPKPQPKLMGPPEIAAVFRRYLNSSSLIP